MPSPAPTGAPTTTATKAPSPAPSASSTSEDATVAAAVATQTVDAIDADRSTGGAGGGSGHSAANQMASHVDGDHDHTAGSDTMADDDDEAWDDGVFGPIEAQDMPQDVELASEENFTQAPTAELHVDDDILDQYQDRNAPTFNPIVNSMVDSDADMNAKHPAWLQYSVGLFALVVSTWLGYKCLRRCLCKKWKSAIAKRAEEAVLATPV